MLDYQNSYIGRFPRHYLDQDAIRLEKFTRVWVGLKVASFTPIAN